MLNITKRGLIPLINAWGQKLESEHFSAPPVVIGGCARSGTTMLLAMLSAHPSIFAFKKELGFLTQWKRDPEGSGYIPSRMDRMYRELIRSRIPEGVRRWCEKSPANVRHIEKILEYFKERVRFIHIIRDPRDVLTSEHPKPSKKGGYYVSAERWVKDVKAGLAFKGHPSVFTLRYEDLVRNPDMELDRICSFIGEEREKELEEWSAHTDVKKNPAWEGEVKPFHQGSIGKWRKSAFKERVEEILSYPGLKELMLKAGYQPEKEKGNPSASSPLLRGEGTEG